MTDPRIEHMERTGETDSQSRERSRHHRALIWINVTLKWFPSEPVSKDDGELENEARDALADALASSEFSISKGTFELSQ